ncbi:MAG: DinB family protein, partial [Planctomycetota bacterium]
MSDQLKFPPPLPGEYHEYYESYIARVNPETLEQDFASQPDQFNELLADLPEGEDSKLHEPYTWTLKQLMGHMIDCERIFSTRMLRIASGDTMPMPGMDQN